MKSCWNSNPEERPSFGDLETILSDFVVKHAVSAPFKICRYNIIQLHIFAAILNICLKNVVFHRFLLVSFSGLPSCN